MRRLILAALMVGCASPGFPPGGPEDRDAPVLLRLSPDTGAVNARPRDLVFRFDEVVSERPQGATSLERLFLISPRDGDVRVDWKREAIAVRPRRGWRANTTYTVTMLPGIADLRGNVRREGMIAVFSTGASIPSTRITGVAFDWPAGRAAPRALVEAVSRPDSTVYVAKADSTGRFTVPHVPPGRYTVFATLDANGNNARDPRELWDSVAVTLADSAAVELLAFVHDTVGPRITGLTVRDSLTLRVAFDKPIDPAQRIDTTLFALKTADSALVPVVQARPAREVEREQAQRDRARADSARRRDTTAAPVPDAFDRLPAAAGDTAGRPAANAPLPSRPAPPQEVIVQVFPPLRPGASYRLEARGIRSLLGYTRTSDRAITLPKAPPPRDSAAVRGARPATADPRARPRADTLPPTEPRPMTPRDTTRRPDVPLLQPAAPDTTKPPRGVRR